MSSGGARARSGPPPDPNALARERDAGDWLTLPADGRQGSPPDWPLTKPTARERHLWDRLWTMPQAVAWEAQSLELTVALYVRRLTIAERRTCPGNAVTVVRQLSDALGLTTPGLRSNKWRIEKAKSSTPNESTAGAVVPMRPRLVADAVEGA